MPYVSYTIYPSHNDPHRGRKPPQVGFTVKPTPNLEKHELESLIAELQKIAKEMEGV